MAVYPLVCWHELISIKLQYGSEQLIFFNIKMHFLYSIRLLVMKIFPFIVCIILTLVLILLNFFMKNYSILKNQDLIKIPEPLQYLLKPSEPSGKRLFLNYIDKRGLLLILLLHDFFYDRSAS